MKATGQVRRIDNRGRVVIPEEVRLSLCIREGDAFEILTTEDRRGVVFQKYSSDASVVEALKNLRMAVEDSELSFRMEFLQSITELEARLKLEGDAFEILTTEDWRDEVLQKYNSDASVVETLKSLRMAVEDIMKYIFSSP